MPVPVSETVCGLLLAPSFMFIVAVRMPVALGENFTLMMQCDLVGTLLPQVLVSVKSPGSAPVKVMPLKARAVERLFVSVTVLAALVVPTVSAANVNVAGLTVDCDSPVPDSGTACGLPCASSVSSRLALRVPVADGVKVTLMVHVLPGANEPVQVLVWAKSPRSAPVMVMLEKVSWPVPLFFTVTFFTALVVARA